MAKLLQTAISRLAASLRMWKPKRTESTTPLTGAGRKELNASSTSYSRAHRAPLDEVAPPADALSNSNAQEGKNQVPLSTKEALLPLALMTLAACLQGFAAGFSLVLNKHFQDTLHLTKLASTGLQVAKACAYIFGAPTVANYILRRFGYRWCLISGLTIYGIGALLFWPAGEYKTFGVFCFASFVMAYGNATIEMTEIPYISTCGPPRYAELRVNLILGLKAVCAVFSSVLASFVIFKPSSSLDNRTQTLMYIYLADGILALLLAVIFFIAKRALPGGFPETTDASLATQAAEACPTWTQKPLRKQLGLWLAVTAIFFQMGSSTAISTFFINFAMEAEGISARTATQRLAIGVAFYTVGRLAAAPLCLRFRPRKVLLVFFSIALLLQTAACVPQTGPAGVWLLIVEGMFRAFLHPTMFTMGLKGLGVHTRFAAGILTAAEAGGVVFTPASGAVADHWGIRIAQIVPTVALGVAWAYPVWLNVAIGKEIDQLSSGQDLIE